MSFWIVNIEHRGFRNLNARGEVGFISKGKTDQVSNQNPQVRGKTGNLGVVHKLRDHFQPHQLYVYCLHRNRLVYWIAKYAPQHLKRITDQN